MAFDEDLSLFFDDFAEEFTVTDGTSSAKRKLLGIFQSPTQDATIYDADVATDRPQLLMQQRDADSVSRDDVLTLAAGDFQVLRVTDDGTGLATLFLTEV